MADRKIWIIMTLLQLFCYGGAALIYGLWKERLAYKLGDI